MQGYEGEYLMRRKKGNLGSPTPPVAYLWSIVTYRMGLHSDLRMRRHLFGETRTAAERVVLMLAMIKTYYFATYFIGLLRTSNKCKGMLLLSIRVTW